MKINRHMFYAVWISILADVSVCLLAFYTPSNEKYILAYATFSTIVKGLAGYVKMYSGAELAEAIHEIREEQKDDNDKTVD